MKDSLTHISDLLAACAKDMRDRRDNEISTAGEVLVQYITDHNDKAAFQEVDRKVNALARAYDRMIVKLDKWTEEARKIEESCDNLYGD
jgi:two-component sensor histidine kinase